MGGIGRNSMRLFVILSGAVVLLALTGCAASQSGIVVKTDEWGDTLRIGDHLYHLTPETELYGADGWPIQLYEVPALDDPGIGFRNPSRAMVSFRASEHDGRRVLERLQLHDQ